jgi:flagellar biosynthesis/type III secretory pathway chaperone
MLADIIDYLRQQQGFYQEMLAMIDREGQNLRKLENGNAFENFQAKKSLLPRLNQSLERLREHRISWQKLMPDQRAKHPEVASLIRQNQDLIMKIIVLDRENEQTLLRRGLVPAQRLPSVHRQQPHFVADLYRRRAAS